MEIKAIDEYVWLTESGKAYGFNVRTMFGRNRRVYMPVSMMNRAAGARMLEQKIMQAYSYEG